jgi:hypothetical protein
MGRRPPLRELAAALAVAALAGCGGGGSGSVLSDSSKALGGVRSGVLSLKVVIEPRGGAGKNPFGFELKGPFTLGDTTLARMTYTQIANGRTGTATFVLGRNGGYVEANGARHALTAQQLQQFRGATRKAAGGGGLQLDRWATSVHRSDCGDAVCVKGDLDPVKAIMGLTQLQRQVGAGAAPVAGSQDLGDAVKSSRYDLVARKSDKVPQKLALVVDFERQVPPKLRRSLGTYAGAKIAFSFALDRPNEDVGLG